MRDVDTQDDAQEARAILSQAGSPVVMFDRVSLAFDDKVVLREISFTLLKGHTKIILGASGSGKSTILKIIVGLLRADQGAVWVNGQRVDQLTEEQMMPVRNDLGMIFQEGALFDSLTVRENVGYKLYEETRLPVGEVDQRVQEVLGFIGLLEHMDKMPSELSGGQRRRVAIARAMAFKPGTLLYDEATTGLDPITANTVNDEIIKLRDIEGASSVVVTHQLRDAFYVARHMAVRQPDGSVDIVPSPGAKSEQAEFIMLRDGLVCFEGDADELEGTRDPYLRAFLGNDESTIGSAPQGPRTKDHRTKD
jgi:phospholipid/cholesterol/gamma-HCH transport system ATP-binding protein